ncbi:MAG TPA: GAF domain-containing protein [Candidatus Mcinerneyibacteriales bacterium]|nr:GAF domain-containing protein [Candidatus Mcinerneyibacteriales bacterium]
MDRSKEKILERIRSVSAEKDILAEISKILYEEVGHYDWVGFYLVNPEDENELLLGPFSGEPTEHVRIPVGRGICGQAVATQSVFVVPDVSLEDNYLSCSPHVRSEIVVPLIEGEEVWGEIDVDSHTPDAFTAEDRHFLEEVAVLLSERRRNRG